MKIGILGGTFNPIHLGHIKLAEESVKALNLDKLIFVPAYQPPHKLPDEKIISFNDRYHMIKLAMKGMPLFELSDIEGKRKGTSYSINTIKEFKKIYGSNTDLFFITGSDSLEELEHWKDIDEIKKLCTLVIATRPGYIVPPKVPNATIIKVNTPDISSSTIRSLIKQNLPFNHLISPSTHTHITTNNLYL